MMDEKKEPSPIPSGVHVAVYNGCVVATGETALEALTRAKESKPGVRPSEFILAYASPAERLVL